MKKRILIVSTSDKLGGAEQFLFNIAKHYRNIGYIVDVYFLLDRTNDFWDIGDNINLYYSKASRESIGAIQVMFKLVKNRYLYDFTFTSHQHLNALMSQFRRFSLFKTDFLICRESTSVFIRFKKPRIYFYRFLYFLYSIQDIDLLICQTNEMKIQLLKNVKRYKNFNVNVINNPIDLSIPWIYSKEDVDFNDYILAIGRLHPVKRFDKLISAYNESTKLKKHKLLILGEGSERLYLEQLITQFNLNNNVILVGQVENVYKYIARARVGVVTSEREGFPNVLLQMYSLNCKVVITPCCGDLDSFPNLYLTQDHSIKAIKQTLEIAIENKEDFSFELFMKRFDIENFVKKMNKSLGI